MAFTTTNYSLVCQFLTGAKSRGYMGGEKVSNTQIKVVGWVHGDSTSKVSRDSAWLAIGY